MRPGGQDALLQEYISIQRTIFTNLSSADLIATHHCMTFLVNSIRLSLSPEPPHNQNDILVTTLLRSHAGLERILAYFQADSVGTRNGGRQLRRAFMQSMQRDREEAESKSPISFGGGGYRPKVKETWFLVATEEMERRACRT
ncbi:hypothetical protein DFH27DRAFT_489207 [Peziza echinospora]|nr:hypothetical protein DFH27DRAFT_489207 [Peziza echinospora]